MEKNMPNQIVNRIFKEYLSNKDGESTDDYFKRLEVLKKELADLCRVTGAIEVMSKNCILKLIRMQSSWRFMYEHSFYTCFSKACDDINKIND